MNARRLLIGTAAAGAVGAFALGSAGNETQNATASGVDATPLAERTGLRPGLELAAMRTAIAAAPATWNGDSSDCARITPMLTQQGGETLAGNFHDTEGNCYVWLNLVQAPFLTGQEICKVALHETGHLYGLEHSPDSSSVMYSPFRTTPVPGPCLAPFAQGAAYRRR